VVGKIRTVWLANSVVGKSPFFYGKSSETGRSMVGVGLRRFALKRDNGVHGKVSSFGMICEPLRNSTGGFRINEKSLIGREQTSGTGFLNKVGESLSPSTGCCQEKK